MLLHTIERLADRIRMMVLERALDKDDLRPIPNRGVLQYFGDDVSFCAHITYRAQGRVVELISVLPLDSSVPFSDPIALVNAATTRGRC